MNNQNLILIVLIVVVIIGGFILYITTDRQHMDEDKMENIWGVVDDHHGDDTQVESYEVYPGEVAEKIENDENIILLDVRTPEEYATLHLENALLLPVQELSQQSLNEIGLGEDMKDKEIYIYCRSGSRSQTAYNIMESLGYTNIKSIAGGMIHWEEDEYPFTESGPYEGQTTVGDDVVPNEAPGPKITFDRLSHDFGVVPQYGGTVDAKFIITNTGKESLEIGDLTTSCSCTSATIADSVIEPGESTILTVIFDPDFHEEPLETFKRTVFIPTNDPQNPEAEVSITVDIAEGQ